MSTLDDKLRSHISGKIERGEGEAIVEVPAPHVVKELDQLGQIIAYEQGELDQDATIELFQSLVDTGLAWSLQGSYGRTAAALIDAGLVTLPQKKKR